MVMRFEKTNSGRPSFGRYPSFWAARITLRLVTAFTPCLSCRARSTYTPRDAQEIGNLLNLQLWKWSWMSSWTRDQTEHHLQSVFSRCDLALAFFYTNPIPESKFDRELKVMPQRSKG